ncbi:MAG: glycosyl transferase family 2 [Synechococcaceae cyanobacterium SM2_3_60]|nr:glycosyl transferase family 2 [Synechococcaceae cyanobacterium SM2_3_60]
MTLTQPARITTLKRDDFISIIVVLEASQTFEADIQKLNLFLETQFQDFEIVVIERKPLTLSRSRVTQVLNTCVGVRFLELSYEIDFDVAVTLGLESAIGDYVVIFDLTQDPLEAVTASLDHCQSGYDIIVGVGTNIRKSLGYRLVRPLVKSTLREIGYVIPQNATTLRCLSRAAVNSVTQVQSYHQQIFVRMSQCGLKTDIHSYELRQPEKVRKTVHRAIQDSISLLIFNSTKPLHWMSFLGFAGSFVTLIAATYSFIIKLIQDNVASGWTSIMILMSFLFMLLFVILSFFGEYMNRIISEQSRQKPYWVTNERHSNVMIDDTRRNISD